MIVTGSLLITRLRVRERASPLRPYTRSLAPAVSAADWAERTPDRGSCTLCSETSERRAFLWVPAEAWGQCTASLPCTAPALPCVFADDDILLPFDILHCNNIIVIIIKARRKRTLVPVSTFESFKNFSAYTTRSEESTAGRRICVCLVLSVRARKRRRDARPFCLSGPALKPRSSPQTPAPATPPHP